jgi:large subunit ribosomal protein L25
MQTVELTGKKRDLDTKGRLRTLRLAGEVPAVLYGGQKESVSVAVPGKEFMRLLRTHGSNMLVNLTVDGTKETVLVKEVQRDIISRDPIHVDFQRISMTKKLEVSVPIHVSGEAPGVKLAGGILEHILREVRVRCLPAAIPTALDVNVSALELNQGLRVKDIPLPEGVEILTDPNQLVVNVVAPTILEEPAAAGPAAPATAEPEVIAKGKKPEEGAEGAAAPAKPGEAKPAAGKAEAKPGKEGK